MTKNVVVMNQEGKQIGVTYPARAKGLVKKGRAVYENDCQIRLSDSTPSILMEEEEMEHKLYFNAREWKFNPECTTNKGERNFISGANDEIAEVYTIASWGPDSDWTEIISKSLILEKRTPYTFNFWLNGGENESFANEVCQLHILFNNDKENALIYKLNRDFIKPIKKHKGWLLFEIPFTTEDNEFTQLKFVACNAYTTLQTTKDNSEYEDLEDVLDEFEGQRPLRHNIIWGADGFDPSAWYSTKSLRENGGSAGAEDQQSQKHSNIWGSESFHQVKEKIGNIKDDIIDSFSGSNKQD